jgi:hypothetical protein
MLSRFKVNPPMGHVRSRRVAAVLVPALAMGPSLFAQSQLAAARAAGVIDGVVTDTGLVSLAGTTISMLGSTISVATGPNGRFRVLQVPAGDYIVIARHVGFRPVSMPVTVAGSDTLRLAFMLDRLETVLNPVTVTTPLRSPRMAEFDARRALGEGEFLTQADIEKRSSVMTTELLRTFRSLKVSKKPKSGEMFAGSYRTPSCPMQIVVDGVVMPTGYDIELLPSPKELAGIEVYAGPATIPLEFKGYGRSCGVVLVWTRDGP